MASPSPENKEAAALAVMPLCARIARRFSGRGAEEEDLRQVALLAAMQALDRYDPQTNVPFAAWCAQYAAGAVRNHLRDHAAVKLPRALYEDGAKLTRARALLVHTLNREPAVSELAAALSWELPRVLQTLMSLESQHVTSFDAPLDTDSGTLADLVGGADENLLSLEQNADLRDALSSLSSRDRELITLRYLRSLSQREAAAKLSMTQMQVHRSEKRILLLLRERLA